MASLHLIRINNIEVPAAYMPQHVSGLLYPESDGTTDLLGRPVGARGFPSARLWWDRISSEAYRWWLDWTGTSYLSVTLSDLILPDDAGEIVQGLGFHSQWTYALMWRIRPLDESRRVVYGSTAHYREGGAEVLITEIGRY